MPRAVDLDEIIRRSPAIAFVWRAEPGWPVEFVSDSVRQLGYEPEELLSGQRAFASIVHPDDLARVVDEVARYTAEGREEFAQEYRLLTAAGEVRWIDDRTWVRRSATGDVEGYQGIVLDITRRKEAEAELARSLRFTESLLSAIPTPVFFKDAQGRYLGCNRAFTEVMGVTTEEIRGKTVYECWPSEHARTYHERDLELMREPRLQVYDFKVRDQHGRERAVIYAKNVFRDERDQVAGIVGAFIDISDRVRMEQELRRRLELERVVMRISTEFVGRHRDEIEPGIASALEALGETTGVDRSYVFVLRGGGTRMDNTHEWCREGIAPQRERLQDLRVADFPSVHDHILAGRAVAVPRVSELPARSPERLEFEAEGIRSLLLVPMTGGSGVLGFLGLDVVREERSWSEDDLSLLRVAGEIFASGLERRRVEDQLREAQKLESVGRLAAGVAHDFNNMLTPILGFAELLLDEVGQRGESRDSVAQIIRAAERSRDLVRQLLAFSRKQILDLRPLELSAVVLGMQALLRRTIREDIELKVIVDDLPCRVRADSGQLEQIVMNLCVNAQDAMPRGGTILIETARVELDASYCDSHPQVRPGPHVMLSLTDTGLGMDERTRAHIFEPFFTTKPRGVGTGLGLATVYGIVRQHGGSIWLYSEPGKGSTFKIYLPAIDAPAPQAAAGGSPVPALAGPATVMLVEDDEMVRNLVRTILTRAGCSVIAAASGTECLRALEAHPGPLHLLLTDVIMQDMNGRELYEAVQRRRAGAPVKVLFMSGYTHNVIAHHGVLEEGVAFIQKPFSVERLLEKVREVLGPGA
jgi:PAS domain S-box-containing protein